LTWRWLRPRTRRARPKRDARPLPAPGRPLPDSLVDMRHLTLRGFESEKRRLMQTRGGSECHHPPYRLTPAKAPARLTIGTNLRHSARFSPQFLIPPPRSDCGRALQSTPTVGAPQRSRLQRGRAMESDAMGSVTRWIGDLKSGGDAAAQRLWERYFQ